MYIYAKFIWKKKVNGGLDEARIRKRIQQSATLVGELFAKITLKKKRMEYIFFRLNYIFGHLTYLLVSFWSFN
jgi:hypothetical protein